MSDRKRKVWLDNIKLIACLAVFWGHFYNSFYGQLQDQSFLTSADKFLIFLSLHVFNFMFNGSWWVLVFCIISGWLAWKKEIDSIYKLAKTLLHRYLRFVIPVLAANIFVIIISKTIGFHSAEVGKALNNVWLASNYENAPQAAHVLKSALLMSNEFVGPLWVLPYIFIGTCALYCWKYLAGKLHLSNTAACLGILAGWPAFYYASYKFGTSWFYAVVVVEGALLNLADRKEEKEDGHIDLTAIAGLVIIAAAMNYWSLDNLWGFITAWLFLWFSLQSNKWQRILESGRLINRLGNLSFTVYLMHCPILYSISMLIFKALTDRRLSYSATAIINLAVSTIIVISFSELYYRLIQKRIDSLIVKI